MSGMVRSMDQDEKVRVNRLRRMATRRGLRLIRSRQRDPGGLDYGKFRVEDATGTRASEVPHERTLRPDDRRGREAADARLVAESFQTARKAGPLREESADLAPIPFARNQVVSMPYAPLGALRMREG